MAWQDAINSTTNFDTTPQNENQGIYILSNKLTKDVKPKFQMLITKLNFIAKGVVNQIPSKTTK